MRAVPTLVGTRAPRALPTLQTTDRKRTATKLRRFGVLVLHAPYYPGWIATIDGKRVPMLRADVLFRGVEVPPGRHQVRFDYRPFSLENLRSALMLALRRRG
jgi:uncharacterized membrane protein YfhO